MKKVAKPASSVLKPSTNQRNIPLIKKKALVVLTHALLILCVLLVASPMIWAILASTQSPGEIYQYPPKFSIGSSLVRNFSTAWNYFHIGVMMRNSLFIAFVVTAGKILISLFAALALVYFRFPLQPLVFFLILLTLMIPIPVVIVPLFNLVSDIGWGNSYWALTLPFFASATGTFLFRQHFMSIPSTLAEAARVDGAGPLRFLFQILLPMSLNTIGAFCVIQFVYMWNQYLWPLLVITGRDRQVVQVAMRRLTTGGPDGLIDWGVAMAGSLIALLPPLIIFFLLQEQFMRGFALSNEK